MMLGLERRLALVMVGLPARGKTFTARKVARYLKWLGYATRWFNVGNYRRERFGASVPASFFDPENPEGNAARREAALAALEDLIGWMNAGGEVAIYDATNSTQARRSLVRRRLESAGIETLFVELHCDDPRLVEANIRRTKVGAPDYRAMSQREAIRDFRARIAHYETAYQPLTESEGSFIKLRDAGLHVEVHRIHTALTSRIAYFLMNLHISPKPIWLTRHGQSEANAAGLIGTDAPLTAAGRDFSQRLATFVDQRDPVSTATVWTSSLQRTIETARSLDRPKRSMKALDEIDAGICDGLTYEQIQQRFPEDFAARNADKLRYRYPRGESYEDVIRRVDPLLLELERLRTPILVVAHKTVIRSLFGYFTDLPLEQIPHIDIPLHTVIQIVPKAYGPAVEHCFLGPEVPTT